MEYFRRPFGDPSQEKSEALDMQDLSKNRQNINSKYDDLQDPALKSSPHKLGKNWQSPVYSFLFVKILE